MFSVRCVCDIQMKLLHKNQIVNLQFSENAWLERDSVAIIQVTSFYLES
jgi:hypothetical protein